MFSQGQTAKFQLGCLESAVEVGRRRRETQLISACHSAVLYVIQRSCMLLETWLMCNGCGGYNETLFGLPHGMKCALGLTTKLVPPI